jgi:hypothetical protein
MRTFASKEAPAAACRRCEPLADYKFCSAERLIDSWKLFRRLQTEYLRRRNAQNLRMQ